MCGMGEASVRRCMTKAMANNSFGRRDLQLTVFICVVFVSVF